MNLIDKMMSGRIGSPDNNLAVRDATVKLCKSLPVILDFKGLCKELPQYEPMTTPLYSVPPFKTAGVVGKVNDVEWAALIHCDDDGIHYNTYIDLAGKPYGPVIQGLWQPEQPIRSRAVGDKLLDESMQMLLSQHVGFICAIGFTLCNVIPLPMRKNDNQPDLEPDKLSKWQKKRGPQHLIQWEPDLDQMSEIKASLGFVGVPVLDILSSIPEGKIAVDACHNKINPMGQFWMGGL